MHARRPALVLALASLLACASPRAGAESAASASSPAASAASPAAPTAKPAGPRLADIAWLAGSWRGESEGARQEEHWLAPDGGLMLGLHRDVLPNGRVSFEYLRIEQRADAVIYQASPGGAPPTPFTLVEASASRAVFSNPEHDFPKRIIYSLKGDALTARIEGDGPDGMEWTWTRGTFVK